MSVSSNESHMTIYDSNYMTRSKRLSMVKEVQVLYKLTPGGSVGLGQENFGLGLASGL